MSPAGFGEGGFGFGAFGAPDVLPTFTDLDRYYMALLIIQYRNKSKAANTVGVFVHQALADDILSQVRDGFDLDDAVGAQLDILGKYRGIERTLHGLDMTRNYFGMPEYDDGAPETYYGFPEYGDDPGWFFIIYADVNRPIYSMNDDELRRIIKLRAKVQSRFLSLKEIDEILDEFFGSKVSVSDNEDMTITYTHDPSDTDTLYGLARQTDSLPRPAGVEPLFV